jgi:chromate transporter
VILNLAIGFSWHALRPSPAAWDGFVAVVAIGAWLAMERYKRGVIPCLGACALLGLVWKLLF